MFISIQLNISCFVKVQFLQYRPWYLASVGRQQMIHQRRSLTHIFLRKDFLFSKELYMLHYINAVYYPHHPNMMVRIYNVMVKQELSYHVREFQKVIPLYIDVFLFCNIFSKENCEGRLTHIDKKAKTNSNKCCWPHLKNVSNIFSGQSSFDNPIYQQG